MKKNILIEFGLNEKEATIYLELLKEKSCTASKLAKLTNIYRTTAYLELDNLIRKGLVSYVIKDSKRYYQPADPEKFIEILDSKKSKIETILPILKGLHKSSEPFKFEIFEGKEGLKTFNQDNIRALLEGNEILSFGVTGKSFQVLIYEFPRYITKFKDIFKSKKNKIRQIANFDAKKYLTEQSKYIQIKYMDKKYFSSMATVIYDNKVAFQSINDNEIYVVVIADENLYNTYKNHFEFMWDHID
ncbi:hypothetical protein HN827_03300 [archaeon]|nr:hypothetical protein [archaeon]MBT6821644.1 hypothetical protein [archaeon]MBT7391828.1 hypothetical protein [archaeon]